MTKTCFKHECFKKRVCRHKIWLGRLALCQIENFKCPYRAKNQFGRYEPEDILLP
ncbi:MAG: hypothetical protein WC523_02115 [Patescibacteria group bacterium]